MTKERKKKVEYGELMQMIECVMKRNKVGGCEWHVFFFLSWLNKKRRKMRLRSRVLYWAKKREKNNTGDKIFV